MIAEIDIVHRLVNIARKVLVSFFLNWPVSVSISLQRQGIWGPFLIVAPASTLHNWQQECTRFVPRFKVRHEGVLYLE